MKTIKLKCKRCKSIFERDVKYSKLHSVNPTIIAFKWKLEYCDKCYNEKMNKSLKDILPHVLNDLSERQTKDDIEEAVTPDDLQEDTDDGLPF